MLPHAPGASLHSDTVSVVDTRNGGVVDDVPTGLATASPADA
ncbi:hypothetical protein [Streptomyces sp. NPDC090021]